jgi:hypothetical protein
MVGRALRVSLAIASSGDCSGAFIRQLTDTLFGVGQVQSVLDPDLQASRMQGFLRREWLCVRNLVWFGVFAGAFHRRLRTEAMRSPQLLSAAVRGTSEARRQVKRGWAGARSTRPLRTMFVRSRDRSAAG